ncbi:MAG: hypothetical protein HYV09_37390 [Deltaproteobacteria bacterium]|nr:hypothetical protein [Deltaproteobacteria bacterium]
MTYWAAVVAYVAALFRAPLLPLVDYPQHLAMAAIVRRIWTGDAAARALYETNLLGYNSLFHVLVAALGAAMSIELAGKLVVAGYVVLSAFAMLQLLDAAERPRSRALLLLPLVAGYAFALGFVNFCLGMSVQLIVLARTLRALREPRPSRRSALITAALALVAVYGHVLAVALVDTMIAVALVSYAATTAARRASLRAAMRAAAPLVPSVVYAATVFVLQGATRVQDDVYTLEEGRAVRLATKASELLRFASGMRADRVDELVVAAAIALVSIAAVVRRPRDPGAPQEGLWRGAMALAMFAAYFALPHVFFASLFIYQRVAVLALLAAFLWAPAPRPTFERWLDGGAMLVAIGAAALFFQLHGAARRELADVDAAVSAAPPGRRVVGLVFEPYVPSFARRVLLHVPALYVARKPGEVAFLFDTRSLPVRRRPERRVPLPPFFELNPQAYDPRAPYAGYYDLVLMKTPPRVADPRAAFGPAGPSLPVLARHGAWWLIDTSPAR